MKETICTAFGLVGSFIAALFGGWDSALATLLIFMGVDYVTGLMVAAALLMKRTLAVMGADSILAATEKILASDFSYTSTFVFAGNTSLRDHIIRIDGISQGTYFFYADGTTTSSSSNFTYNKLKILNY